MFVDSFVCTYNLLFIIKIAFYLGNNKRYSFIHLYNKKIKWDLTVWLISKTLTVRLERHMCAGSTDFIISLMRQAEETSDTIMYSLLMAGTKWEFNVLVVSDGLSWHNTKNKNTIFFYIICQK